jgi:hypothetical protein
LRVWGLGPTPKIPTPYTLHLMRPILCGSAHASGVSFSIYGEFLTLALLIMCTGYAIKLKACFQLSNDGSSEPFFFPLDVQKEILFKPRLRVRSDAEALARGQLAELHLWKFRKLFPYQSNSQNFFKFYCHFLGRRARGVFPVPLAFAKKFSKFCPLAEKRGSLEGVRERGFNVSYIKLAIVMFLAKRPNC